MTPAQLQTIEEIFRGALGQEPDQAGPFLDTACAGDELLRCEVEALLASHQRAGSFIESPVAGLAARIIENGQADLLVGQAIGHYKISKRIGAGGMGEVYLATDITAGRKAALKLLPARFTGDAERLKRFQQEARAVVALNHPNILTVYEIGEDHSTHYIASELIEGETLRERLMRGRMPLSEAIDVAIQTARALAAAHEAGIVHRDIKPENIMLRPDGYVKVLDFGIAKLAEQEVPVTLAEEEAVLLVETHLGSILGTVRYMSPEQARGAPVDQGTDIWSLGVVFYEMVAGHAPFPGDTPREVMNSILEVEPSPLTSSIPRPPAELQQIISNTLRKDRQERYQSTHQLLEALQSLRRRMEFNSELERTIAIPSWRRWTRSPTAAVLVLLVAALALALRFYWHRNLTTSSIAEKSIAVLPFENLSRDPDNAFFTGAVQDEILTDLAKIADLKVIGRTSVMQYKSGAPRNLREIGQQLGVAHVVEGSVQRAGNRVRVNAQLVDARNDAHLWAQTYDRDLAEVFAIQSEIAKAIADQLQVKQSPREKAAIELAPTSDIKAFDLYSAAKTLNDSAESSEASKAPMLQAAELLNHAVARDPSFFQAYCLLADTHDRLYFWGEDYTAERLGLAEAALEAAFRLQPDSGEAHLARARHLYWGYRDYDRAQEELTKAQRALPNNAQILNFLGLIDRRRGRLEEAIRNLERAVDLDPRNITIMFSLGETYAALRKYGKALAIEDRALALEPPSSHLRIGREWIRFLATADTTPLRAVLNAIEAEGPSSAAEVAGRSFQIARNERDPAAAARALANSPSETSVEDRYRNEGLLAKLRQDAPAAQAAFIHARAEAENLVRAQPENALPLSDLALFDAELGDKKKAIQEGRTACDMLPVAKDALTGVELTTNLARVYVVTGEKDLALEQLDILSKLPFGPSYGNLVLEPEWDPLRGDPRFEKLVESLAPEVKDGGLSAVAAPEKSIAVLPFENLTDNKEGSEFAAGIQDDLLTSLAQIHDMKVISRTSVMAYKKGDGRNVREIARALGVANVVEGSVRREGDRVLVNVQLIDARNDRHLWAERYDRTVADSIGLQGELATQIAVALKATLAPEEKARLGAEPTSNSEAYVLYLTALGKEATDTIAGEQLYVQATALDPKFALAHARASLLNSRIAGFDHLDRARKAKARAQAEEALRLSPTLGEAHMALGVCLYWGEKKYETALKEFEIAAAISPNNAEIYTYVGGIYRRQGRWSEAVTSFDRALSLDPRNARIAFRSAINHLLMRDWPAAAASYKRVLEITPDEPDSKIGLAYLEVVQNNNPAAGRKILQSIPPAINPDDEPTNARWDIAMLERDYASAEKILADPGLEKPGGGPITLYQGRTALVRGDAESAKRYFAMALPVIEGRVRDDPNDPETHGNAAILYAYMDKKEDALREARRALELEPESQNAFFGAIHSSNLALVYALAGEQDEAITLIERLLTTPGPIQGLDFPQNITLADLRLRWEWDSLRSNPRFQKILAAPEPKTVLTSIGQGK